MTNQLTQAKEIKMNTKFYTKFYNYRVSTDGLRHTAVTKEEAQRIVAAVLAVYGMEYDTTITRAGENFSHEEQLAWGVDVQLYVRFDRDYSEHENPVVSIIDPELNNVSPDQHFICGGKYTCQINWSSTVRDIVTATAAVNLYQKMIAVAADIETIMGRVDALIIPEVK